MNTMGRQLMIIGGPGVSGGFSVVVYVFRAKPKSTLVCFGSPPPPLWTTTMAHTAQ